MKTIGSITIEILPDPYTMQEIEFYPDGKVKRVVFRETSGLPLVRYENSINKGLGIDGDNLPAPMKASIEYRG